jgi:hypothetical protein
MQLTIDQKTRWSDDQWNEITKKTLRDLLQMRSQAIIDNNWAISEDSVSIIELISSKKTTTDRYKYQISMIWQPLEWTDGWVLYDVLLRDPKYIVDEEWTLVEYSSHPMNTEWRKLIHSETQSETIWTEVKLEIAELDHLWLGGGGVVNIVIA